MTQLILLNKPYLVLCQFTDTSQRSTLASYISIPDIYPAGRLDYDSEGLVVLTNNGKLQHLITDPKNKLPKIYLVQIEGTPNTNVLKQLALGVKLNDGLTLPAEVSLIDSPQIWPRVPPIRERKNIPTTWIKLIIREGRNRQVRRMTAAIGHPTLRLIRIAIGEWKLGSLQPGEWQRISCI
ncbi:MAG: 23S rRNA pseudouridine synthase [bacterium]|nr:MAG: 23S rRNA pseudouridine synthase [bacterium]